MEILVPTAWRHPSAPSQSWTPLGISSSQENAVPPSPYAPVGASALVATKSRGPRTIPLDTAFFRSTSANPAPSFPMSRSVVKPCSSAMRIAFVARSAR